MHHLLLFNIVVTTWQQRAATETVLRRRHDTEKGLLDIVAVLLEISFHLLMRKALVEVTLLVETMAGRTIATLLPELFYCVQFICILPRRVSGLHTTIRNGN